MIWDSPTDPDDTRITLHLSTGGDPEDQRIRVGGGQREGRRHT